MKNNKKKVMVAEDDEGILGVLTTILEMYGYEVMVAKDETSLQNMKLNLPDLILLDVWMGSSDGRKICRFLKEQKSTKHIPVIMVSATRDLDRSARLSGADDYLEKPFDMEDLINKVKKLI